MNLPHRLRARPGPLWRAAHRARHSTFVTGLLTLLLLQAGHASGQSLRCNGHLAGPGDSRFSVVQKCGEPLAKDAVCVSRLQPEWIVSSPDGSTRQLLTPQCVPMEDWTYSRGAGSFLGVVRFQNGVVESVRDGERMP